MTTQPTGSKGNFATTSLMVLLGLTNVLVAVMTFRGESQALPKRSDQNPNVQSTTTETNPQLSNTMTQAESLLQTVKAGLQQPRQFPFTPEWSEETYDPETPVDTETLKKLKRHVMVRNFYSSNARLTPAFRQLIELLSEWGIESDPILIQQLFGPLRGMEMQREMTRENPELVEPSIKKELQEMLITDKAYFSQVVKELLNIEDPAFITDLLKLRPKEGFGMPDTRIEPGERLLIQ